MNRFKTCGFSVLFGAVSACSILISGCDGDDSTSEDVEDAAAPGTVPDGGSMGDSASATKDAAIDSTKGDAGASSEASAADAADAADAAERATDGADATLDARIAADTGTDVVTAPPVEAAADATNSTLLDATADVVNEAGEVADAPNRADVGVDASPDALSNALDAANDGGDGSSEGDGASDSGPPPSTYSIIMQTLGPACADAALSSSCLDQGSTCEDATGTTPLGSRQQLCYDTLSCILGPGICAFDQDLSPFTCYCGNIGTAECQTAPSAGICLSQEQAGLETTDPGTIIATYDDPSTGGGLANAVANCIFALRPCFSVVSP